MLEPAGPAQGSRTGQESGAGLCQARGRMRGTRVLWSHPGHLPRERKTRAASSTTEGARGRMCSGPRGGLRRCGGTHTRHGVLVLDDNLTQQPPLVVLVHGGQGRARRPRSACSRKAGGQLSSHRGGHQGSSRVPSACRAGSPTRGLGAEQHQGTGWPLPVARAFTGQTLPRRAAVGHVRAPWSVAAWEGLSTLEALRAGRVQVARQGPTLSMVASMTCHTAWVPWASAFPVCKRVCGPSGLRLAAHTLPRGQLMGSRARPWLGDAHVWPPHLPHGALQGPVRSAGPRRPSEGWRASCGLRCTGQEPSREAGCGPGRSVQCLSL